jgi:aryl-alcohol dehydrogenase-like predicted oxidoreductase
MMKYRQLGGTRLSASVIGLGTWQFGGEWGRNYTQGEVDAILDQAAESGINLIDTAECYGDHLSESLIGDYLARRPDAHWIIATKFGHRYMGFMDRSWHLAPDEVQTQLEASLRALKRDCLDLYQFHSGTDETFQNPALWDMLAKQKEAGKIRHLGISITSQANNDLQARQAAAVGAAVLQVVYNRLERKPEQLVFPHARQHNLGILARVPLASGFLTGKYQPGHTFPPDDVRATFPADKIRKMLAEVETIKQEELPSGIPLAQWALAWCLKNPLVSAVIPGCKDPAQVRFNAAAAELV